MTDQPWPAPVEDRLADRISPGTDPPRGPVRGVIARLLRSLGRLDRRAYQAVARLSTPALDAPLRHLSRFANFSKPWFVVAGVLAVAAGSPGRRAALTGVGAIGVASLVVNQPMKMAGDRVRPDRVEAGVPAERWVSMPTSTSFPSGHSASAAAFAVAVGDVLPGLRLPLWAAGSAVAFSRTYTGVHYPGDVLAGVGVGAVIGRLTSRVARHLGQEGRTVIS